VFHLHGYSFYVVGVTQLDEPTALTRIQELDRRDTLLSRNLVNPVLKDTVTVPSNGVSVLRFKADNPGKADPWRKNTVINYTLIYNFI
jgi:FtsP/CotA-like multicopper oxidase with cupredoxin domain